MSRRARIVIPGVAHHVTQRGNYGQDVFFSSADRTIYLRHLRESACIHGLRVSAYCLMTNHVHLIVIPESESSLGDALGRTHTMYAQHIHHRTRQQGHFWQSRFYSNPMDETHTWQASAYVELNPVRAGMVRAPWEYPWSSAAVHCGMNHDTTGLLSEESWYAGVHPKFWQETLREIYLDRPLQEKIRCACQKGIALGDSAFIAKVQRMSKRPRGRTDHP